MLLVAVLAAIVLGLDHAPIRPLRLACFDAYQVLAPRPRVSAPVVIVEIDDASLREHGQWPWPRTKLARLLAIIAAGSPAAVGIDIVMPEPDRLSPSRLADLIAGLDPDLARRLSSLPSNDAVLGATLSGMPAVLGLVGLEGPAPAPTAPISRVPVQLVGGSPRPFLPRFTTVLGSVDEIAGAVAGHGFVNAELERGVVRRFALMATVGDALVPALAIDMLRVAAAAPAVTVRVGDHGVEGVGVLDFVVPTQSDGAVRIHYGLHDPARFVSAAEVLSGAVNPARFERRLVLVGVTAVGLGDHHATPVSPRMAGVEVLAQLLEGILDGDLLTRPRWAPWAEAAFLATGAVILLLAVPALPVWLSGLLALVLLATPFTLGFVVYRQFGVLLDAATPTVGLLVAVSAVLGLTLADAAHQRRIMRRQLEAQREAAARMSGELEAARRIQMGTLPSPTATLAGDDRIDLYGFLEPARAVGGDLYDFFRLDGDRVLFLIGDVSGNGVPASLFMAVSKALGKSTALRRSGDLATLMREWNAEVGRDNPEAFFVSVWVGVLDARTGDLEYCNAGHEPAWALDPDGSGLSRLTDGGGPVLCAIDAFAYRAASYRMRPGELICLVTDGVTEALDEADDFYGRSRLEALLAGLPRPVRAAEVGEAIRRDVADFAGAAEPSDDLSILVVQWRGPGGPSEVTVP